MQGFMCGDECESPLLTADNKAGEEEEDHHRLDRVESPESPFSLD